MKKSRAKKLRVYAAGPWGFQESTREWYYETFIPALEALGFGVIDPWKLTDEKIIAEAQQKPEGPESRLAWAKADMIIGRNNQKGIDAADIVIACLDGVDMDSGTAAEIGYAFAKGKKIFGYRSDFRNAGDNPGTQVNLQVAFFILQSGGTIAPSLEMLLKDLRALLKR